MKFLALDTASAQCSVALVMGDAVIVREVATARDHAQLILPMIDEVLAEGGTTLRQLQGIAFGRGPGSFTGVRIAIGVAQGLAYALGLPVLPISDLAAVAQQVAAQLSTGERVLVCMDARMGEIYTGVFAKAVDGLMVVMEPEQLLPPDSLQVSEPRSQVGLGTGFRAYPVLRDRCAGMVIHDDALPRAREIVQLAVRDYVAGLAVPPDQALPVYLRDQVVHVKTS